LLYQEKVGRLLTAGKPKDARDAAAKVAQYMPGAQAQMTLGAMDYNLGDKTAALADFRQALQLDPNVRRQFFPAAPAAGAPAQGGRGQRLRAVLEDKEFLKQLFPE
jgi:tetratricopeptide (TPR) repeat protein